MSCCAHCQDSGEMFTPEKARDELRKYRKDGPPNKSTHLLIEGLRSLDLEDKRLLDVGGGVGMIQHELLREGLATSTMVEASTAYLEVAKKEARRRGYAEQSTFRYGDFVDLAPGLPEADLVTLDRVICCYPHMNELVQASTAKATCWYGVTYPKPGWYLQWAKPFFDLYCWFKDVDFRIYLHQGVDRTIQNEGFDPFYEVDTILWKVALYERTNALS